LSRRLTTLLALLLPLPLVVHAAQPATVEDAPLTPEEVTEFKDTVARFADRMQDFNQEARLYADDQEQVEREKLRASYAQNLNDLSEREAELREGSISHFETFLARYPAGEYTPHVMFRLGELYFENSEEDFQRASIAYDKAIQSIDPSSGDIPAPPVEDYAKSLALYRRIVTDYPSYKYVDGAYYMLGYCLGRVEASQYDPEVSRDMFAALVDHYPDSKFAADANLRLGEYYFDKDDLDSAILHYQRVVDLGKEGRVFDKGLYKLAWSYYRKAKTPQEYQHAIGLFADLLDWSEENLQNTGKESSMAPEAIQYMAISFSDLADRESEVPGGGAWDAALMGVKPTPLSVATEFFGTRPAEPYQIKVIKRLSEVLIQQARYDEAIATLNFIQEQWPEDPDNPTYQREIAQINMTMKPANVERARQALLVLNEKYNDGSPWASANHSNPDALDTARKYIEESLANVATNYHQIADQAAKETDPKIQAQLLGLFNPSSAEVKTAIQDNYKKAAELYQDYLNKFPFANDYYEIQSYLATVLQATGRLTEAEDVYVQLLKAKDHPYHDAALWQLMQVRRQLLTQKYGKPETRPDGAVEEKRVALPSGKERVVYAIDDDHKRFIEVADELVDAQFTDAEYKDALDQFRPALAYLPAQILYNYGHYDEARPRFEKIISTWPTRDEAAFSASLMVDSYADEENLAMVRQYSGKYTSMNLGTANTATKISDLKNLQEMAAFNMAVDLTNTDRAAAAEAFLAFMKEFPQSKYGRDALYNAANSYDIIGRVDEANRLFEDYVIANPTEERSAQLFFRIASNYSSVLQLDKAIRYYETLVKNFPKYPDAATAIYNAGFLRIGLGDHEGAAKLLERYAHDYPAQKDAEQVMFQAGTQYKLVSDASASAFYGRYLRAYPEANPDHVMEAYHELAVLAEKTGNTRNADKAWADLAAAYNRLSPGGQVGQAGRHYAASYDFRKLKTDSDAIKVYTYANDEEKDAKLVQDKKAALEKLIVDTLAYVDRYKDFEYSSAALYLLGAAHYEFADMVYKVPCPKKFSEFQCDALTGALDQVRLPVEEKGKARLISVLDLAKQESRWSDWQTKAIALLSERDPQNYSTEKSEIRGTGDSNLVPTAGPEPLPRPKAAAPAPTGAAPAGGAPTTPTEEKP